MKSLTFVMKSELSSSSSSLYVNIYSEHQSTFNTSAYFYNIGQSIAFNVLRNAEELLEHFHSLSSSPVPSSSLFNYFANVPSPLPGKCPYHSGMSQADLEKDKELLFSSSTCISLLANNDTTCPSNSPSK